MEKKTLLGVALLLLMIMAGAGAGAGTAEAGKCHQCWAPAGGGAMQCPLKDPEQYGGDFCMIFCHDEGCSCSTVGQCDGQYCDAGGGDPDPVYCEEGRILPLKLSVLSAPSGPTFAARLLRSFQATHLMIPVGPISGLMENVGGARLVKYHGRVSIIEGGTLVLDLDVDGKGWDNIVSAAGKPVRIETWRRGGAGRVEVDGVIAQEW